MNISEEVVLSAAKLIDPDAWILSDDHYFGEHSVGDNREACLRRRDRLKRESIIKARDVITVATPHVASAAILDIIKSGYMFTDVRLHQQEREAIAGWISKYAKHLSEG